MLAISRKIERAALPYDPTAGLIVTALALFHQIGASLAGGSVLIARTTAATDGTDQLASVGSSVAT